MHNLSRHIPIAPLLLIALLAAGLLAPTASLARSGDDHSRHRADRWEDHRGDRSHLRSDHRAPAKGWHRSNNVVRELPRNARRLVVDRNVYFCHEDHFYRRQASGYVRVSPPLGVIVSSLPRGFVRIAFGNDSYYHADDIGIVS